MEFYQAIASDWLPTKPKKIILGAGTASAALLGCGPDSNNSQPNDGADTKTSPAPFAGKVVPGSPDDQPTDTATTSESPKKNIPLMDPSTDSPSLPAEPAEPADTEHNVNLDAETKPAPPSTKDSDTVKNDRPIRTPGKKPPTRPPRKPPRKTAGVMRPADFDFGDK